MSQDIFLAFWDTHVSILVVRKPYQSRLGCFRRLCKKDTHVFTIVPTIAWYVHKKMSACILSSAFHLHQSWVGAFIREHVSHVGQAALIKRHTIIVLNLVEVQHHRQLVTWSERCSPNRFTKKEYNRVHVVRNRIIIHTLCDERLINGFKQP